MSVTPAIRFGPFCLSGRNGPLLRDGQEIKLQRKSLAVLWTLACRMGEPVTRSDLMDAVWPGAIVVDDALSFQIKVLRQAIEDDPRNPQYILTAHRIGFRLVTPSAAASSPAGGKLVGREAELEALREALVRAGQGQRQFVFVSGEAGIGKTALIDQFLWQLRNDSPASQIWRGRCLEMTGETEAYQPIIDALEDGVGSAQGEEWLDQLRQSAPSWLRQLPRFLAREDLERLRRITSGIPPERLRRELAEALEAYTAERTLVLVIEDLHWCDASTITVLDLLAQRDVAARLLVICSCRPVETILSQHPARALQLGLTARARARTLFVDPLPLEDGRRLVRRQLPDADEILREELLRGGEGHPLFLMHLTDYVRDHLAETGAPPLPNNVAPPRLRELIELQLSQLTLSEQLLLEVGAVAGPEFAAEAVAAGSAIAVDAVEEGLEALAQRRQFIVERGLSVWPDGAVSGRFQFRHALYAQALYQRVGEARRARLHRRLAERLELAYSGRGADIATDLAYHYEAGGVAAKAAEWCVQTAQNALNRVAHHEVREQVARGLAQLMPLAPDLSRHRTELRLRILASQSLQMEYGYAANADHGHRDRIDALIDLVGDDPVRTIAVQVQWFSRHFNMESERAIALAERLRLAGKAAGKLGVECEALGWASHSLHTLGKHEEADRNAAEARRLVLSVGGGQASDMLAALVSALSIYPLTRWYLGYPEQGLAAADEACSFAERQGNPYTYGIIVCATRGYLLEFTGDYPALLATATDVLELAHRTGHRDSQRWSSILLGIAQYRTGDLEAGRRTLQPVLDDMRQQRLVIQAPLGLVNLARIWSALGEHKRAVDTVEEALQLIRRSGHRPWEPEVLRTLGEVLRAAKPRAIAAATVPVWEALELARTRKALSLELRAATTLARLLRAQGRVQEALALLEPVLGRFTEGSKLPDQCQARQLILELRT